jgi:hypothetical protein
VWGAWRCGRCGGVGSLLTFDIPQTALVATLDTYDFISLKMGRTRTEGKDAPPILKKNPINILNKRRSSCRDWKHVAVSQPVPEPSSLPSWGSLDVDLAS